MISIGIPRAWLMLLIAWSTTSPVSGQEKGDVESRYATETEILYRTGDEVSEYTRDRCRLDLYYPKDKTNFATVVWLHGGGLTQGNKAIPRALTNQGIAVVAANYRLSPAAKAPSYIEDAAAAVAWTYQNIEHYGGSRRLIFVSGHSAGGYLTSMVGLDPQWLRACGVDANTIAGLIPLSGQCITHFTIRAERGTPDKRPIIDTMAPLYHVRGDAAPILLISGDRNRELVGRYEETAYFWRMLKEVGHPQVDLIELQGYDHGGMAEPAFPLLLKFVRDRVDALSRQE